jgi:hypothetical protein
LPNLTMMPVVGGAECLDAVQLCRTALVRWTQRRTSSQRIPWDLIFLLCSSPFAWLQPWYDTGWGFSPSTRVQLQQLCVNSAFMFSGHSLCIWPLPPYKHREGCLQLTQTWPKFWQL